MKKKGNHKKIVFFSALLILLSIWNHYKKYIIVPIGDNLVNRQMDFITICTVFAGFSFTVLGLLLGLSSEKLIKKIQNTEIMINKMSRIISSISFLILSVAISLFFVLGLNTTITNNDKIISWINDILYFLSIGYLIIGISYFVFSVYELSDLFKRIYNYNQQSIVSEISEAKIELEKNRTQKRKIEYDED